MRLIDLTGKRFGSLLVICHSHLFGRIHYWKCKCNCGVEKDIDGARLRDGRTTSCGCQRYKLISKAVTKHGAASGGKIRREYGIWCGIKARCFNPNVKRYPNYGGRGITMCDRWRNSYQNFFEDMGPCPSSTHSIERKNNDGNYEPGNCVWATPKEQANNRRTENMVWNR